MTNSREIYPFSSQLAKHHRSISWLHRELSAKSPLAYRTVLRWVETGEAPAIWIDVVKAVLGDPAERKVSLAAWVKHSAGRNEMRHHSGQELISALAGGAVQDGDLFYVKDMVGAKPWWFEYAIPGVFTGRVNTGKQFLIFPGLPPVHMTPPQLRAWAHKRHPREWKSLLGM